jgi:hypothetical protein
MVTVPIGIHGGKTGGDRDRRAGCVTVSNPSTLALTFRSPDP